MSVKGGSYDGVLELIGSRADGSATGVGQLRFVQNANTTGKTISYIIGETEGGTANNRGGTLQFWTKANAGSLAERMRIGSDGKVGIGTTNLSGDFTVSNGGANGFEINPTEGSGASNKVNSYNRSTSAYTTLQFDVLDFRVATGSSATERMRITSGGDLQFNSGYGSVATAYGCRAWVNFNGTGTVAIRASGNVSSITDNGQGDYTVNFTTAMPDTNYALSGGASRGSGDTSTNGPFAVGIFQATTPATGSVRIQTGYGGSQASAGSNQDAVYVCVAIHR